VKPPVSVPSEATTDSAAGSNSTFQDAKKSRDAIRPSRVGGGIFRASGQSTVFPTREIVSEQDTAPLKSPDPPEPKVRPAEPAAPIKPPTSLFEFIRAWDSLSSHDEKYLLLSVRRMLFFQRPAHLPYCRAYLRNDIRRFSKHPLNQVS
jgi:hypothetical protein